MPIGGFDRSRQILPLVAYGSTPKSSVTQTNSLANTQTPRDPKWRIAFVAAITFSLLLLLCVIAGLFFEAGTLALFFFIILLQASIAFGCILGGVFAIWKGLTAETKFKMLGVELGSQNVGVAFMGIGIVVGYWTFTRVIEKVEPLGSPKSKATLSSGPQTKVPVGPNSSGQ